MLSTVLRTLPLMEEETESAEGFGHRLQTAMKLAGLNATQLAVAMRVTPMAIKNVLPDTPSGRKTKALSALNCAKAAGIMGVDAHWLATGKGVPRPQAMQERAALSVEAVHHAAAYDKLTALEKAIWHTMIGAAKAAAAQATAQARDAAPGDTAASTAPALQEPDGLSKGRQVKIQRAGPKSSRKTS